MSGIETKPEIDLGKLQQAHEEVKRKFAEFRAREGAALLYVLQRYETYLNLLAEDKELRQQILQKMKQDAEENVKTLERALA